MGRTQLLGDRKSPASNMRKDTSTPTSVVEDDALNLRSKMSLGNITGAMFPVVTAG
jgi:hypothetical protein